MLEERLSGFMCPALDRPCFIDRHLGNAPRHGGFSPCYRWHQEGPVLTASCPPLQCTVTCGGGVQTRSVHCVQQGRPSSRCLLRQKPPVLRACNTNFCAAPAKRGKGPPPRTSRLSSSLGYLSTPAVFSYAAPAQTLGGAVHIRVGVRSPPERCPRHTHQGSPDGGEL